MLLHGLNDLSWADDTVTLCRGDKDKGLELHNLDNLFGRAILTNAPVVKNYPLHDPHNTEISTGPPGIESFLGIPVLVSSRVVGLIGLINGKREYSFKLIEYLSPLTTALGQIIIARQDRLARQAMENILKQEAKLDGLLTIPNRRYFNRYLSRQLKNCRREQHALSLIMIDVDYFKLYNDCYGHQMGDQCLIKIARAVQEVLNRPMDMVARYGGEELCCILPDTKPDGAMHVAGKIRKKIASHCIPHRDSLASDMVTVSMGVATCNPASDDLAPHTLIEQSDKALYEAKRSGRNRIIAYCIRV